MCGNNNNNNSPMCVCCHPIYSGRTSRAGVTQEEGHTGFLHLPSVVLAFIFLARSIQPFLSLVDREVEFCIYNIYSIYIYIIITIESFSTTCWDVSSIPANGIFLTKTLEPKAK